MALDARRPTRGRARGRRRPGAQPRAAGARLAPRIETAQGFSQVACDIIFHAPGQLGQRALRSNPEIALPGRERDAALRGAAARRLFVFARRRPGHVPESAGGLLRAAALAGPGTVSSVERRSLRRSTSGSLAASLAAAIGHGATTCGFCAAAASRC